MAKETQLVRVDFYKPSGKWYAGGLVEKEILYTSERGYFKEIIGKQKIVNSNFWMHGDFTVVTSARHDENFVGFHEQIWHADRLRQLLLEEA